ncbi:MAG: TetR/AcrR family transcriptional repressor of nem operon, partial [Patiriisocius sp.]
FQLKMEAIFSFFEEYMHTPLYKGGCPLMNAAIEVDDTNVVLRQQTYNMLAQLKESVGKLITNGKENGQVRKDIDANYYGTIIIATLEGAIMMSRLERTDTSIKRAIAHLRELVMKLSV